MARNLAPAASSVNRAAGATMHSAHCAPAWWSSTRAAGAISEISRGLADSPGPDCKFCADLAEGLSSPHNRASGRLGGCGGGDLNHRFLRMVRRRASALKLPRSVAGEGVHGVTVFRRPWLWVVWVQWVRPLPTRESVSDSFGGIGENNPRNPQEGGLARCRSADAKGGEGQLRDQ